MPFFQADFELQYFIALNIVFPYCKFTRINSAGDYTVIETKPLLGSSHTFEFLINLLLV